MSTRLEKYPITILNGWCAHFVCSPSSHFSGAHYPTSFLVHTDNCIHIYAKIQHDSLSLLLSL